MRERHSAFRLYTVHHIRCALATIHDKIHRTPFQDRCYVSVTMVINYLHRDGRSACVQRTLVALAVACRCSHVGPDRVHVLFRSRDNMYARTVGVNLVERIAIFMYIRVLKEGEFVVNKSHATHKYTYM